MTLNVTARPAGSLPVEVTGFVGRVSELAQVTELLGTARLVTLLGPGGVGKTRIALRVAADLAGRYADGVCLVELSSLREPDLLAHTITAALGLSEQDARPRVDVLLEYLRDRNLLLILDTCEHLVDACAMLADLLLRESAGVTVLATSRQPLDVPGEHTWAIAPLPVPDPDQHPPPRADGRDDGSAIELFEQRARAVVPGFTVTPANRRDVIRLCRRLDGIPLAIELATVRLRAVPLEELADRLEDRFRLLAGGRRTTIPRHQTLRTALDWSHELCTAQERLLWRRLSVFAGSFDVAAAEQVCAGPELGSEDVLEVLVGLVDKSAVLRVNSGPPRYRQLDTIREYGAAELHAAGERDEFRQRHVDRYLVLAREFNEHLIDTDQLARFRALAIEHSNIRVALEYALALPGQEPAAARLCTWLWGYWQISRLAESRYWLTKILERFTEPSPERAWCLAIRGYTAANSGDATAAITDLDEAAPLARQVDDRLLAGRIGLYYNLSLALLGRYPEATRHERTAAELMTASGDRLGLIHLDIAAGYQHFLAGEPDRALASAASALGRLGEHTQERWLTSYARYLTGAGLYAKGDYTESARECGAALLLKRDLDDILGMAYCLELSAWISAAQGRPGRTAWLLGAADALWQRIGIRLSGAAAAEAIHADVERAARNRLGEDQFRAGYASGGQQQLSVIVELAAGDADTLITGPAAGSAPAGRDALTTREREVAGLIADGLSNREIADRLTISKRTVDAHVEHIFTKLGVTSRVLLVERLRS